MATLKLNNTTVFTETNGIASIPSAVKFPAGHVVQVVTHQSTSYLTSSGTIESVGLEKSITPKLSGSKLIFNYSLEGVGQNTNAKRLYFYLYKNGSLLYQTDGIDHYGDGVTEQYSRWHGQFFNDSTSSGVAETYDLRFSTDGGLASVTRGGKISTLVIYEVVQ